jgi:hypothetical protein
VRGVRLRSRGLAGSDHGRRKFTSPLSCAVRSPVYLGHDTHGAHESTVDFHSSHADIPTLMRFRLGSDLGGGTTCHGVSGGRQVKVSVRAPALPVLPTTWASTDHYRECSSEECILICSRPFLYCVSKHAPAIPLDCCVSRFRSQFVSCSRISHEFSCQLCLPSA